MKRAYTMFFVVVAILVFMIMGCSSDESTTPSEPTSTPTVTETATVTQTPTTTPDCTMQFGETGADAGSWSEEYLVLIPYTPGTGGSINVMWIKLLGATNFRLGLYDDNAGEPGNLLCQSDVTGGIAGWNSATVPSTSYTAGTKYYIALITATSASKYVSGGVGMFYKSYSWSTVEASGLPAVSVAGWTTIGTLTIDAYAENCVY